MGGAGKSTILALAAGEETDDIEATKGTVTCTYFNAIYI